MVIWLWRVDKKYCRFLVTSGCLLSRKVWWVVWICSFCLKIEVFYQPECFTWSLNCPKKCSFCKICVDLNKKSKSVKAIYIYTSESSHYTVSEMVWFISFWAIVCVILTIKISGKMLIQQKFNKTLHFQTLISPKQYVIA